MTDHPVGESLREVDANGWIFGNRILLSHTSTESFGCWSDGDGSFYGISEASEPLPPTQLLRPTNLIQLV